MTEDARLAVLDRDGVWVVMEDGLTVICSGCYFAFGRIHVDRDFLEVAEGIVDYDPGPGAVARTLSLNPGLKRRPDADGVHRLSGRMASGIRKGSNYSLRHNDAPTNLSGQPVYGVRISLTLPVIVECPFGHQSAERGATRVRLAGGGPLEAGPARGAGLPMVPACAVTSRRSRHPAQSRRHERQDEPSRRLPEL